MHAIEVAVLKETYPGERRVALIPASVPQLAKAGIEVLVEQGAGVEAGFRDGDYVAKGASLFADRGELFGAQVVLGVRACGTTGNDAGQADRARLSGNSLVIGTCDPLGAPELVAEVAGTGATLFALELIPRITRAQSMDVLSSQATIAGYRAVLIGAFELPRILPLLMSAAGTLAAARVFVIGAGVAGLQAIATARRLGAIVRGYDVRPATREQVESLGAKFVEMELESGQAEDQGGYAKALGEEFYEKQRALMAAVVAESDLVITTAAIPGQPSPRLITTPAVQGMAPGSVIVDLAAERGGNCELTQADRRTVEHGVVILGPTNLPSEVPLHASQMFSTNCTRFLLNLVKNGQINLNLEDAIIRETLVCRAGEVTNERIRQLLGTPPAAAPDGDSAGDGPAPSPSSDAESGEGAS
jgi:H+-translocating NAD(P) transhydrogenase subunit alpha